MNIDQLIDDAIGREGGIHSMEFYTELRNICIKH